MAKVIECLFIVHSLLSLLFFIVKLSSLFSIMINSNKNEPSLEARNSILNNTNINFTNLFYTILGCQDNLENFVENGVYETFNFKMKKINKYSKGLLSVTFIDLFFSICLFVLTILIYGKLRGKIENIWMLFIFMNFIIYILNLIFFILLSVYYYKGKYEKFLDFGKCDLIDKDNFDKNYGYIIIVFDDCKNIFIIGLLSLIHNIIKFIIIIIYI